MLSSWVTLFIMFIIAASATSGGSGRSERVKVRLAFSKKRISNIAEATLRVLEFCQGCPNPHLEGSRILGLGAAFGPEEYSVQGLLVYTVPNHGGGILNVEQLRGQVAFLDRGVIPLVDKVLAVQAAGALAAIIADDGSCEGHFECGLAGSLREGGFANRDSRDRWRGVNIPSLLLLATDAQRLRSLMKIEKVQVPGHGDQWIESYR